MTLDTLRPPYIDANRWELAHRLTNQFDPISISFHVPFQKAIATISSFTTKPITIKIKMTLQKELSARYIPFLRKFFLLSICETIFKDFTLQQINTMLREHRKTGCIKTHHLCSKARQAYQKYRQMIIDLTQKNVKMIEHKLTLDAIALLYRKKIRLKKLESRLLSYDDPSNKSKGRQPI